MGYFVRSDQRCLTLLSKQHLDQSPNGAYKQALIVTDVPCFVPLAADSQRFIPSEIHTLSNNR